MAEFTTKVVVWTDPESGGLNIAYPVGADIDAVRRRAVPDGVTSYIIDKSDVPTDRSFRNAWTYTE
tara:strand:+ start:822 stop:1019 length:198 start_codon:yes stop_codon:yes gene_type:complete